MPMNDRVTIETRGAVAEVRLTRADKLNALDEAMFSALAEAGAALGRTPGVRAIVLSGEGRAFCAGLDRSLFQKQTSGGGELLAGPRTAGGANRLQQAIAVWREMAVPVIAAVQGQAFGGGLQLALAADMRILAPDAQLSVMEIRWGIVPDLGGIGCLRRLVRDDVLRDLVYSGRVVGGEEALGLGLATRLAGEPRAAALSVAGEIATKSPDAIRAAKTLINLAADASFSALLRAESEAQASLIGKPNQIEAVMANLQARTARYAD
jgi:enoyl-CoA hydratase/carnithine racemase